MWLPVSVVGSVGCARLRLLPMLCIILVVVIHGQSQPIFDPRVYNFYFYLNTNPDLTAAGIVTPAEAQHHWQNNGIQEGRQACGSFHSLQFLDNYPDLKTKFGTNYSAAIEYYVATGFDQQLLGYTPGGAYGRYTIADLSQNIWLSGSDRMAGAIDSIVWEGVEFINAWDHGRELQMAVTTTHGECYNPTEAGSSQDLQKSSTTSVLQAINLENNTYRSTSLPAFWMVPGQSESGCGAAVNTEKVSTFTMHKQLEIGYGSLSGDYVIIHYVNDVVIPLPETAGVQIEAPTAYLNAIFDTFYSLSMDTMNGGKLTPIAIPNNKGGSFDSSDPVIIATKDGKYAMGVLPRTPPQRGYALYNFVGLAPASNGPSKWSIVTFFPSVAESTDIKYENWLCIGSLSNVQACMVAVHSTLMSS